METVGNIYNKVDKIRLLVVDDHQIVRQGLAMVLGLEEDIEVCGQAGNGTVAIQLAQSLKPNLILMDLNMPGVNGLEAAQAIKNIMPECKILILTGVDADATIFEALQTGIDGYILKEVPPDELARAVRTVAAGEAYLHPAVTRKVLTKLSTGSLSSAMSLPRNSPFSNPVKSAIKAGAVQPNNPFGESLSERELEVLRGVALGQSNREIAEALIVGEETVRTHLKSAFRKLGVNDRTQAVVVALKNGLLEL